MRPKKKTHKNEIKLDKEDLGLLFRDRPDKLVLYINNVFCGQCTDHMTSITDFDIYLNDLNDTILEGKCIKCGGPVARYIETGENPQYADIIKQIRTTVKKRKTG